MNCFATLQNSVQRLEVVLPLMTAVKDSCAKTARVLTKATKGMRVNKIRTARTNCFATLQKSVQRMEVVLPLMTVGKSNCAKIAFVLTKATNTMHVNKIPTARRACFATLQTSVWRMENAFPLMTA